MTIPRWYRNLQESDESEFRPDDKPSRDKRYQYDRERVVTDDLAIVLERIKNQWEREYSSTKQDRARKARDPSRVLHMGFVDWLSTQIDLPGKLINRIINRDSFTTSYYLADRILNALNVEYKLMTGEVRSVNMDQLPPNLGRGNGKKFKDLEDFQNYLDSIGCRR